jgi:hypothetical protein
MVKDSENISGLKGLTLTSVNFTMDYLTLDFNDSRLTFGLMPTIVNGEKEMVSTSDCYADSLRKLIGETIVESRIQNGKVFLLKFEPKTVLRLELVETNHEVLSISGPNYFELVL